MTEVKKIKDLIPFFAENKKRLLDFDWLAKAIQPHCKYKFLGWRGSRLRIIQHPTEFARFLIFMARNNVRSYLEIGTSTGGSFMTVDAYLRAAVDGYERSVGYDRTSKLRDFDEYKKAAGTIEFRHENSSRIRLRSERFDMSFIDARHIKAWVLKDFQKVKDNSRFVGFHDIALRPPCSVKEAWGEIKTGKRSFEFIETGIAEDCRCGIGVIDMEGS